MNFLKNYKRFSFKIGEKSCWKTNYTVSVNTVGNETVTTYCFESGIKITNVAKKYSNHNAYEWFNYIENTGDKPTEIISELWDCDVTVPLDYEENKKNTAFFPHPDTETKIYAPSGSDWSCKEFYCDVDELRANRYINHIYPNETRCFSASYGRTSGNENAPFFNICKNGKGYIFAIGWSGQWNCEISRTNDALNFKSKVEDTFFRLLPNEKLRTSSVVMMSYNGDFSTSQNKWRKLVKEEFSLIGKPNRPKYAPLAANAWGGLESKKIIERVEFIKNNNLPYEYFWIDAGWYGKDTLPSKDEFEGDWHKHTGDWAISPKIHPNNLKDVSKSVHDNGMKLILWFEPERVIYNTTLAIEHPEWILTQNNAKDINRILNLGNCDAWEYCHSYLYNMIKELNIDCLRIDYNTGPLEYWRGNDAADRRGLTEIKYVNALYKLWDSLLSEFPNLIIDNCSSGGRRLDIETLRRSVPLWRSDAQCPANTNPKFMQNHTLCFNNWMPYSGTGCGRIAEEYIIRSSYASSLVTGYFFSEAEDLDSVKEKCDFIKKYTEEYLKIRPYYDEDFYALTELSDKTDVWCAVQYNRPSKSDGILQVFAREKTPYKTAIFKLKGLKENANYKITDLDGGSFIISGSELMNTGFEISINHSPKAKIYIYELN